VLAGIGGRHGGGVARAARPADAASEPRPGTAAERRGVGRAAPGRMATRHAGSRAVVMRVAVPSARGPFRRRARRPPRAVRRRAAGRHPPLDRRRPRRTTRCSPDGFRSPLLPGARRSGAAVSLAEGRPGAAPRLRFRSARPGGAEPSTHGRARYALRGARPRRGALAAGTRMTARPVGVVPPPPARRVGGRQAVLVGVAAGRARQRRSRTIRPSALTRRGRRSPPPRPRLRRTGRSRR
jgi:hypothetical protein